MIKKLIGSLLLAGAAMSIATAQYALPLFAEPPYGTGIYAHIDDSQEQYGAVYVLLEGYAVSSDECDVVAANRQAFYSKYFTHRRDMVIYLPYKTSKDIEDIEWEMFAEYGRRCRALSRCNFPTRDFDICFLMKKMIEADRSTISAINVLREIYNLFDLMSRSEFFKETREKWIAAFREGWLSMEPPKVPTTDDSVLIASSARFEDTKKDWREMQDDIMELFYPKEE